MSTITIVISLLQYIKQILILQDLSSKQWSANGLDPDAYFNNNNKDTNNIFERNGS